MFGNVDFVKVIFSIHVRKMRFSTGSQNSLSENAIFGHFEVIFFNVGVFPRARVAISC